MKPSLPLTLNILWMGLMVTGLQATPSGLGDIPDIRIPNDDDGQPLPVEFRAHSTNPNVIYIKPTFGKIETVDAIKSPVADCDQVENDLDASRKVSELRPLMLAPLDKIVKDLDSDEEEAQKLRKQVGEAQETLQTKQKEIQDLVAEAAEQKAEVKRLQDKIDAIDDSLLEKNPARGIDSLKEERAALVKDLTVKEDKLDDLKSSTRKAKRFVTNLELAVGPLKSQLTILEEKIAPVAKKINELRSVLENFDEATEKVLQRYSNRVGGYLTIGADFAPSRYIRKLEEANAGKKFIYIPSLSARVDMVGPVVDTAAERRTGTAIIGATWSDAARAREKHPFSIILAKGLDSEAFKKDPFASLKQFQTLEDPARFENSVTGGKFLNLELSVYGYCALKFPGKILRKDAKPDHVEMPFKLALYYTYPEYYALKMSGLYHSYSMLYDFWKSSSSSSWFGLSKKQKIEHMRRYTQDTYMNIKIEPIGVKLSLEDSLALSEKMKDQVLFGIMRPHLELAEGTRPIGNPLKDQKPGEELSAIGKRMMMVPNPWVMWTGVVLSSLGGMFGRSSTTVIDDQQERIDNRINYENGVVMEASGEALIGDYSSINFSEGK